MNRKKKFVTFKKEKNIKIITNLVVTTPLRNLNI